MDRVALLGGSFDPPHRAHLHIAQFAYKQLNLSQVIFIPCFISPHKQNFIPAAAEDRLNMLQVATEELSWASVSDWELQRERLSYSIDTVLHMRDTNPGSKLFWIMGSDQWEVFDAWYRADDLADMLEFIVFPRPSLPQPQPGKRLHMIDRPMDVSSSQIRELLVRGGDVSDYLNPEVEQYIRSKALYLK